MTPLWSLAPGSRPYLTVASLPNERGMTYNSTTDHLILVNRTSPTIHVLNAANGADLWTLDKTGIAGGTYALLMVGAADDGAIYAGNLTTAGTTTDFRLYRWSNDSSSTLPTLAYSGDPGAGNSQRWGDTMDLRGGGTNTQIIVASRSGNVVAVFTTADGVNFSPTLITVADAPTGAFGLGLAFGAGNTFWGKATSQNLRQVQFNLQTGTGTTIRSHGSPGVPSTVAPIGLSPSLNLMAGINVGATNNHLRLYDLTSTNGTPVLLASANFATDNDNTGTGTGAVDFSAGRVYALGANNGLLALEIQCAVPPAPPAITSQPQNQTVIRGGNASFNVTATGDAPLAYQWWFNGGLYPDATNNTFAVQDVQETDAGGYYVVITNASGATTSAVVTLTVLLPPEMLSEPQSQTVGVGQDATLQVVATGTAPLAYQWQHFGTNLPNATTSTFTQTNAQVSDSGDYYVVVTNFAGSVTSAVATLLVIAPVPGEFKWVERLPDGSVQLRWDGHAAFTYTLETSTNLSSWLPLTDVISTNGVFEFTDLMATNGPQRFYRLRN